MMTFITKNKDKILDIVQLILFFLLGFKFFDLDMYISIVIFVFIVFRLILQNRMSTFKETLKKEMWDIIIASVFCISTVLFKSIFDGKSMLFKNSFHFLFLPVMFWLSNRTSSFIIGYKGITHLVSYFAGNFFYISLCVGVTFAQFGLKSDVRLFMDVWTHKYMSSTIASIYLIPVFVLCISGIAYLIKKRHFAVAPALLIPIFISGYISVRLENRGFFIAAVIALFLLCYIVFFQFNNLRDEEQNYKYFFLAFIPLFLSLSALLLVIFVRFNVFGVADAMKNIPFLNRIVSGGTDKMRSYIYKCFFENSWRYPFGGLKQAGALAPGDYVHNAFLDLYAVAGIIPFACFVYFVVRFIINVIFKKKYRGDSIFFLTIISLFIAIFCISLFEPIFDANAYYFASFFGIFSIITKDSPLAFKKKKNQAENQPNQIEKKEEANENSSAN